MVWALVVAWSAVAQTVEAPIPTPLEVLAFDATPGCPTAEPGETPKVVRTNFGLARHLGDGTFGYGCPSALGGVADAQVAADPTAQTLIAVGPTGLWRSEDGGCRASLLTLAPGDVGYAALFWRNAFWLLAAHSEDPGASLYRMEVDTSEPVRLLTWADFRPDGMIGEDASALWLAGATPAPQLRRIALEGGLSGDTPIAPLPVTSDLQALRPVAARAGEAWIRAERRTASGLWEALSVSGGSQGLVIVTDAGVDGRSVLGPVWFGDAWLAAVDQQPLQTPFGTPSWSPVGAPVGWTCLGQLGTTVWACSVGVLDRLVSYREDGSIKAKSLFLLDQIVPGSCPGDACAEDLATLAAPAGVAENEEPALCPDGATARDLGLTEGCGCTSTRAPAGVGVLALLWLARRRRL
jgi:MYXO-CTERM domain-containing protein